MAGRSCGSAWSSEQRGRRGYRGGVTPRNRFCGRWCSMAGSLASPHTTGSHTLGGTRPGPTPGGPDRCFWSQRPEGRPPYGWAIVPGLIFRSTKIAPRVARYAHRRSAGSCPFHKSAVCIIATNASRPEPSREASYYYRLGCYWGSKLRRGVRCRFAEAPCGIRPAVRFQLSLVLPRIVHGTVESKRRCR